MTNLTELEEVVWTECVSRRPAPDDETIERWQSDKFVMHQEHFRIRPLSAQHHRLYKAAIAEWSDAEQIALNLLGMTQGEFDTRFPVLRDGFLADDEESRRGGAAYGMAVQGAVRNMDMINCFASFLPRAVPDQRNDLAKIGRRIAALYYLEQIYKAEQLGRDYAAQGLKRVDAMWRFAGSLCD